MGLLFYIGCDNIYDSWSSLGDGSLQEKLARYLEIFGVQSQEALTQALELGNRWQSAIRSRRKSTMAKKLAILLIFF